MIGAMHDVAKQRCVYDGEMRSWCVHSVQRNYSKSVTVLVAAFFLL